MCHGLPPPRLVPRSQDPPGPAARKARTAGPGRRPERLAAVAGRIGEFGRRRGARPARRLHRVKEKYRRAGRPAYTKTDLARRVREDALDAGPDG
ncbi:hypothetical protein [Streptomyces katrae]|uniref:hypothetical protein n=1 Tax=Streptomyces katrae TaxID=68223 RepID=UPI001B804EF1|nr:hypothetical protein [Streptomyces katrae]